MDGASPFMGHTRNCRKPQGYTRIRVALSFVRRSLTHPRRLAAKCDRRIVVVAGPERSILLFPDHLTKLKPVGPPPDVGAQHRLNASANPLAVGVADLVEPPGHFGLVDPRTLVEVASILPLEGGTLQHDDAHSVDIVLVGVFVNGRLVGLNELALLGG